MQNNTNFYRDLNMRNVSRKKICDLEEENRYKIDNVLYQGTFSVINYNC